LTLAAGFTATFDVLRRGTVGVAADLARGAARFFAVGDGLRALALATAA